MDIILYTNVFPKFALDTEADDDSIVVVMLVLKKRLENNSYSSLQKYISSHNNSSLVSRPSTGLLYSCKIKTGHGMPGYGGISTHKMRWYNMEK